MKQTFNFLLMLVMVATVLSCKKKDPELTPAQKIVGKYKMTAFTGKNSATNVVTDIFSRNPCYLQETLEFTSGGQIITSYPTTGTCIRATQTGSYTVAVDGSKFTINGTFDNPIIELTSTMLKYSTLGTDNTGASPVPTTLTYTYTKI